MPDPARLARVAQTAAEQAEIAGQEAAVAARLDAAAAVAAGYVAALAAAEQAVAELEAARVAALAADRAGLAPAIAQLDALRRTAGELGQAADYAGLLHRGRARQQAAAASQAARDAANAFQTAWGHERGIDPANQAVERIAYARARRWDQPIGAAKTKAAAIRTQGREAILAALGNLDPTWVRHYARTLDQAVQASEPDRAQTRLQEAAANLRESSRERAKLSADLQAASPQERLNWLDNQEAAAEQAWRYQERVEPIHRRPEDESSRRPNPDITPRW